MYYYIKNKETNKIVCYDTNKENLIQTLPFLKHIGEFTIEDIQETTDTITMWNNNIVFITDIKEEYLNTLKQSKIKQLKDINKEHIYSKYTQEQQIDIMMGIDTQYNIDKMKEYILNCLNSYNTTKNKILNINDIDTLNTFDIKKDYSNNLIEEEKQKNTKPHIIQLKRYMTQKELKEYNKQQESLKKNKEEIIETKK